MENPSTTPPSAITSNGLFFVDGKERQGSLPGDLPRQGLAAFSRCRTSKRHTSKDYLAPHRLPGTPLAYSLTPPPGSKSSLPDILTVYSYILDPGKTLRLVRPEKGASLLNWDS